MTDLMVQLVAGVSPALAFAGWVTWKRRALGRQVTSTVLSALSFRGYRNLALVGKSSEPLDEEPTKVFDLTAKEARRRALEVRKRREEDRLAHCNLDLVEHEFQKTMGLIAEAKENGEFSIHHDPFPASSTEREVLQQRLRALGYEAAVIGVRW